MTYLPNVNIKEECLSPLDISLSVPGSGTRNLEAHGSSDEHYMDGQNKQVVQRIKRYKSESSEIPASNHETKSKLKNALIGRRIARGDTEVPTNLFEEPKPCQLTASDLEKRAKRRTQNRKAAKRCREKKKEDHHKTAQERYKLEEENTKLKQLFETQMQRSKILFKCLSDHLACGDCKLSVVVQEEHMRHLHFTDSQEVPKIASQDHKDQSTIFISVTPTHDGFEESQTFNQNLSGIPFQLHQDQLMHFPIGTSTTDCGNEYEPNYQTPVIDTEVPYISCKDTTLNFDNGDSHNNHGLSSWDLTNIQPLIPDKKADPQMLLYPECSRNNLSDLICKYRLKSTVDDWQHDNQFQENSNSLNKHLVSNCDPTFCATQINANIQEDNNIPLFTVHSETVAVSTTERDDQFYRCVPPNLVQPNCTIFQSCSDLYSVREPVTRANNCDHNLSSGNRDPQNSLYPDFNNNNNNIAAGRPTTTKPRNKKLMSKEGCPVLNNFITDLSYSAPLMHPAVLSSCFSLNPISPESYRQ